MNFVEAVLRYTKESESPRKYFYWSALASIAGVVKNNVYLDRYKYILYPNIYVLLVGRSGLRKGPPVSLARGLVEYVDNTRVFSGRITIEGLIVALSDAVTKENGGPPLQSATGFIAASEFASFIVHNPEALTILTDLYDSQYYNQWIYTLKNSPPAILDRPCITMIGASNEAHLKDCIPENAIGGGFIARTFIIYADKKAGINPLTRPPASTITVKDLEKLIFEISKIRGGFKWTDDGRDLYEDWYQKFSELEESKEDSTGTLERIHDHILKTAMLVSLARAPDKMLMKDDVEEAIRACQDFIPGAKRIALGQTGKSISAPGTAVLLRELITNPEHKISRSKALEKYWAHFDFGELDRIAESLFAQRAITIQLVKDGDGHQDTYYFLQPKVLEKFEAKQRSRAARSDGDSDV